MILGGGTMQIPSIKIAKKKGWRVIVADGNPIVEGRQYADHFAHIDLKDINGMEKAARHYNELFGLHGIFTAGTDFSTTVAYIAEKLNLPGIPYEVACNATNKSQMRSIFKIHSVPSPDFITILPGDNPEKVLNHLRFPFVVKPVDNMGSRGVRRVDSIDELHSAVISARQASSSKTVIIEEFMEGPELSLDAIIYNGLITICGIADRHIYFPPYFVEMGHTMPTNLPEECINEVVDVFCRGIRALGITDGAAKGDIIVTKEGPKVGEIAARLSGGYMSGWTFPFSTGIDATEAALHIAVGLPPGNLTSKHTMVSAERAIISIPGRIASLTNVEGAQSIENIREVFIRVQPNDSVVFPQNNVQKCGNIISQAATREEAISACERAIDQINIRLQPDNDATNKFLFSPLEEEGVHSIMAYPIKNKALLKRVQTMPYFSGNKKSTRIAIAPLPEFHLETGKDWHGKTIETAIERVFFVTGIYLITKPEDDALVLERIFWEPFFKGGSQAGIYIIDSIKNSINNGCDSLKIFERWIS